MGDPPRHSRLAISRQSSQSAAEEGQYLDAALNERFGGDTDMISLLMPQIKAAQDHRYEFTRRIAKRLAGTLQNTHP